MNERIKELALQAEEYALRECDNNGHFHQIYREKFAELIVKECAGIYHKIDNGNLHMGTDDYLEALYKTFFGVEE
jgi:hypothetical protein